MLHYQECLKLRPHKKLDGNTYLDKVGDDFEVRLHGTAVVTIHPDDSRTLNTGGWFTHTTKDRINNLGIKPLGDIHVDKGVWIYTNRNTKDVCAFADGMRVLPTGEVEGAGEDPAIIAPIRKLAKEYCHEYTVEWSAGRVEKPNGGDPWNFAMASTDGELPMLGDPRSWFFEECFIGQWYPGILLYRAVEKKAGLKPGDHDGLKKIFENQGRIPGFAPVDMWAFVHWINTRAPFAEINNWQDMTSGRYEKCLREYVFRFFGLPA